MSRSERMAKKWFHWFNNNRMLFGFISLITLTACSIYFNFKLGQLNSNPSDYTSIVMPLAYSFLDVAALAFAMVLFAGLIRGGILNLFTWAWFGYLVTLSLFACLSCIIALDAQNASSGDEFKRQKLEAALVNAEKNVATWQNNVDKTEKHKSRFQDRLDEAYARQDDLIAEISKLDASTPAAQVIFESGLAFMPAWMDEDQFRLFARMAFGIAMIITPLLLTGVLANILGSGTRRRDYDDELEQDDEYDYVEDDASSKKPQDSERYNWSASEPAKQDWSESKSVQYDLPESFDLGPKTKENSTKFEEKPNLVLVKPKKSTPPRKQKGAVSTGRKLVREAILSGKWTKYDDFIEQYGVSRSTISSVIKELKDSGLITKQGHNIVINSREAQG